ncbi:hypothetical protein NPA07_03260 [Mycoplasmopsis caviae]|uniref:Uncharacterized protein n=1 Tax=Mycoplasmopsis caviae TaxID=55603 RepID=A0A3P8LIK8_9BACT|nr:hypothetical protein [Mycoplasmopsis caviae]UUD34815.1 hypothetical protein NPA07_03260 [Mycoplasmopsis caviae]VDR42332.1 Uncharacterised protein [Mycoplasmopsis caviae]
MKIFKDEKLIKEKLEYYKSKVDLKTLEKIANLSANNKIRENYVNKVTNIFKYLDDLGNNKGDFDRSKIEIDLTNVAIDVIELTYIGVIEHLPTIKPEDIDGIETFVTNLPKLGNYKEDDKALKKILSSMEAIDVMNDAGIYEKGYFYEVVDEDLKENGLQSQFKYILTDIMTKPFNTEYIQVNDIHNEIKEMKPKEFINFFNDYDLYDFFSQNEKLDMKQVGNEEDEEESLVSSVEFSETSSQRM